MKIIDVGDLIALRDDLCETDAITIKGLMQINKLIAKAEEAPTETKKGKWVSASRFQRVVECSECGYTTIDGYIFCPFCGADMRGKDE